MNPTLRPHIGLVTILYSLGLFLTVISFHNCQERYSEDEASSNVNPPAELVSNVEAERLYANAERYRSVNQKDSAILSYQQSLAIFETLKDSLKVIEANYAIASMYLADFKYEIAEKFLERARGMVDKTKAVSYSVKFKIYDGLAKAKMELKDFPTAISLTQKTMTLALSQPKVDNDELSLIFKRLANIHFYSGNYDQSIVFLTKAIEKTELTDNALLGMLYSDIALTCSEKKQFEKAIYYYNKSIKHDLQWAGVDSDPIAKRYVQKSFAHRMLGQNDSALILLNKNLEIRQKTYGDKNKNTFGAKYSLGQYFFDTGEYESALGFFQLSLISLIDNFNSTSWRDNPNPLVEDVDTDLILGLVGKASAMHQLAMKDSTSLERMQMSLKSFLLADSIFSVFRSNLVDDDPQLAQLEAGYIPYEKMLSIAFSMFNKTNDTAYLTSALRIMERSRGLLLTTTLNRVASYSRAGLPVAFKEEESRLIGRRKNLLQQIGKVTAVEKKDSLYAALLEVNNLHQDLLKKMEEIAPEYVSFKYGSENINIESLTRALGQTNSVLFDFFLGTDAIYVLMIGETDVKAKVIRRTKELDQTIKHVINEFSDDSNTIFKKSRFQNFCLNGHALFQHFFDGLLDPKNSVERPNLIISSDGVLSAFPFEVLLTERVSSNVVDYHLPYLGIEYRTSYVFSANAWLTGLSKKRVGSKLLTVGYGNKSSQEPTPEKLSNLPGSLLEVKAIQKAMRKEGNNVSLSGDNASESSFKKMAPDFNIIHMAIHGLADTVDALQSHLIFGSPGKDLEDEKLYAHELYDLNLEKLDLVVLSACESGIGKVQQGEGMMSIARGFAYAGCPSMVISVWKIDDLTASQIMTNYYNHVADHRDLDFALQKAKVEYLSTANEFNSHPSYWAAYLQIGDTKPIAEEWRLLPLLYSMAGVIALCIVVMYSYKRINKNKARVLHPGL